MGLLRTAGKVAVATRVHGSVQRRQRDRWAAQDAAPPPPPAQTVPQVPPQAPPVARPAPPLGAGPVSSTQDVLGQLAQLGQLRESGVLTPDEFETQKARILGTSVSG